MSVKWAIVSDATGVVLSCGTTRGQAPGGAIAPPGAIPLSALCEMMWTEAAGWVLRPDSPGLTSQGSVHTATGCPPGTVAEVYDPEARDHLGTVPEVGGVIEIDLPDPAVYLVEIHAPAPYLMRKVTIDATEA